jgi:hypothetical protein
MTIAEKQEAIKKQRSFNIKLGSILVKNFTKGNDPVAKQALEYCAKMTSNTKDSEAIRNFIKECDQLC